MGEFEPIERVEIDPAPPPCPPSQDEPPCGDDIPLESERHKLQMESLLETLQPWLAQRGDGYAGGNMFLYFSLAQTRGQYFRGPDVFVVLGVPGGRESIPESAVYAALIRAARSSHPTRQRPSTHWRIPGCGVINPAPRRSRPGCAARG